MRRERKQEREMWTAFVQGDGGEAKVNKYGAERTGKYPSKHEAEAAANLAALERADKIRNLKEQVRIVLVPGDGKLRPIVYVADFAWESLDGKFHVGDAKGYKTAVYRLKKRMAALLLGIAIEEL